MVTPLFFWGASTNYQKKPSPQPPLGIPTLRLQRMSAMAERFENPNPSGQVVQLRNEVQQRSQERPFPVVVVGGFEDSHHVSGTHCGTY